MFSRPSFIYNTAAQTIYTFTLGGLAVWMPTYFMRVRAPAARPGGLLFGGMLCLAGFAGHAGGRPPRRTLARTRHGAHFDLSGYGLDRVAALHGARDPVAHACYLLASDVSRCS